MMQRALCLIALFIGLSSIVSPIKALEDKPPVRSLIDTPWQELTTDEKVESVAAIIGATIICTCMAVGSYTIIKNGVKVIKYMVTGIPKQQQTIININR